MHTNSKKYTSIAQENRKVAKSNEQSNQKQMSMDQLPLIDVEVPPMELFNEETNYFDIEPFQEPFLRHVARSFPSTTFIPREKDCFALWDTYGMLDNIREHSYKVACFARDMARMIGKCEGECNEHAAYAAGLLHDLGKTYSIKYGGSHAQLGSCWVMDETRNGFIARAVLFHVYWPWEDIIEESIANDAYFISLAVAYADKRVRHDEYVSLDERFEDLHDRYGISDSSRERIEISKRQGKILEKAFSQRLEVNLETYTPDCRGLVI